MDKSNIAPNSSGKVANESLEEIKAERASTYGPYKRNMATAGKQVTALLEQHYQMELPHPIPGYVMAHIMVAIKINRAVVPLKESKDNYDDAHNYLDIAYGCDERFKKGDLPTPDAKLNARRAAGREDSSLSECKIICLKCGLGFMELQDSSMDQAVGGGTRVNESWRCNKCFAYLSLSKIFPSDK